MKEKDTYNNIAKYYDYMLKRNPQREKFFARVFHDYGVKTVLDCACGTGNDLVMFDSLGLKVTGSDLSDAMLDIARKKIKENNLPITIKKADFHELREHFDRQFDAVVCLSNAVNEADIDIDKALGSFKSVLKEKGIIVFDQGQTDYTMKNPPRFFPEVNDRDFTRLYIMDYQDDLMKVDIFDFLHKETEKDFRHSEFSIRIRLYDDWVKILKKAKLTAKYYGDWDFKEYSKSDSKRLIVKAKRL